MRKILIILLITVLVSCKHIHEGVVIDKYTEAGNEYMLLMPMPNGNGGTMTIPMWYYDDPDYIIVVKGIKESGDSIIQKFYYTENQFDSIHVGQWICVDG